MKYKTIQEMRDAIGELMKRLGDMKAQCVQDNREYTEEERKTIRQIQFRVEDLKEQIELEEKNAQLSDEFDEKRSQRPPTKPQPDNEGDPAARARGQDPNEFRSFGEFLGAVMVAGNPDRPYYDERLRMVDGEARATGLSEGIGSEGGFLLQPNFSNELVQTVWEDPDLLGKVNKITITKGNSMTLPGLNETSRADGSRQGGIRMYWKGEADEKTASKPDFREIKLKLKKLIGLVYLTDELMDDVVAMEGYVRKGFNAEMRFQIIKSLVSGTGAGQPMGILASPSLVTVNKETGQAAATVQVENIVNMWSRMIASARLQAVWHINQDVEPQLYTMGITVGTGGSPIFMPPGGLSQSPYATLMGRPIIPLEQCSTLGTKGDLILASWPHYLAIDKGPMQAASSIHVRFIYDESCFRFVYRFDGEPELASAITPHSGSGNTLSHFVTLQAR